MSRSDPIPTDLQSEPKAKAARSPRWRLALQERLRKGSGERGAARTRGMPRSGGGRGDSNLAGSWRSPQVIRARRSARGPRWSLRAGSSALSPKVQEPSAAHARSPSPKHGGTGRLALRACADKWQDRTCARAADPGEREKATNLPRMRVQRAFYFNSSFFKQCPKGFCSEKCSSSGLFGNFLANTKNMEKMSRISSHNNKWSHKAEVVNMI